MRKIITASALTSLAAAAAAATLPAASLPAISHSPRVHLSAGIHAAGWASSNWSGYAITGGAAAFTSVTGHWTVPSVTGGRHATYSSNWAGIDGFNNSDLIQAGTEQDYYNGRAHYDAWWEILPAAETVIPSVPVQPGDGITVSIRKGSGSSWVITLTDSRSGSFTTTQSYSGPGTSAEWIEEAPEVGGRIATLAKYGSATFDPGTVNGANPHLVASESGAMIQGNAQVSTPSNPDSDSDGFRVAYGATAPSPPTS